MVINELTLVWDKASGKGGDVETFRLVKNPAPVTNLAQPGEVSAIRETPDHFLVFYSNGKNRAIARNYITEFYFSTEEIDVPDPEAAKEGEPQEAEVVDLNAARETRKSKKSK